MTRRRSIEVFTLSFLDCICCGFGAVILFYTIVSAQSGVVHLRQTDALSSEVSRLREQVLTGERNLVALRDALTRTRNDTASARRETNRIVTDLESRREQLSSYDAQTLARRAHIEQLKADIRSLEESNRRLEAGSPERAPLGQQVSGRAAAERRYITGLTLHGGNILILLDVSASMLHQDLVEILKLRNQDDAHKRAAAKWRRAVAIVDWLMTQVPTASHYQVLTFNTQARPLLPGGGWLAAGDAAARERGMQALELLVPANGTSLYNAFAAARTLVPLPDQIVLITDGLPTQGKSVGLRRYVNSAERVRLFDEAVPQLPEHAAVDSVLLPMQGDLQAAHRFWHLARVTDGTLLMPAKDWP
ncbi:MAG TPA: VWA domain-containing protein [Steroidobacteraceae bacterium]|nr:VWA domain-containing protein [Steroidobacteraceae bacterium]